MSIPNSAHAPSLAEFRTVIQEHVHQQRAQEISEKKSLVQQRTNETKQEIEKFKNLEASIEATFKRIIALKENLSEIEENRSTYAGRLSRAEGHLSSLRSSIPGLEAKVETRQRALDLAQTNLRALREPVDDGVYQRNLAQYEAHVSAYEDQIHTLKMQSNEIMKKREKVYKDIQAAERKFNNLQPGSDESPYDFEARSRPARQQLESLAHQDDNLVAELHTIDQRIYDAESAITALVKPVDDGRYQREMEQYELNKTELQSYVDDAQSDLDSAEGELYGVRSDISSTEDRLNDLIEEPSLNDQAEATYKDELRQQINRLERLRTQDADRSSLNAVHKAQEQAQKQLDALKQEIEETVRTQHDKLAASDLARSGMLKKLHDASVTMASNHNTWDRLLQKMDGEARAKWSKVDTEYTNDIDELQDAEATLKQRRDELTSLWERTNSDISLGIDRQSLTEFRSGVQPTKPKSGLSEPLVYFLTFLSMAVSFGTGAALYYFGIPEIIGFILCSIMFLIVCFVLIGIAHELTENSREKVGEHEISRLEELSAIVDSISNLKSKYDPATTSKIISDLQQRQDKSRERQRMEAGEDLIALSLTNPVDIERLSRACEEYNRRTMVSLFEGKELTAADIDTKPWSATKPELPSDYANQLWNKWLKDTKQIFPIQ